MWPEVMADWDERGVVIYQAFEDRIVEAAGFGLDVGLRRRIRSSRAGDHVMLRGDELVAALDLAGEFPARHDRTLDAPVFGR